MSALHPFVRAFRALAVSVSNSAAENSGVAFDVLEGLSSALSEAATDLEQKIANDLARLSK